MRPPGSLQFSKMHVPAHAAIPFGPAAFDCTTILFSPLLSLHRSIALGTDNGLLEEFADSVAAALGRVRSLREEAARERDEVTRKLQQKFIASMSHGECIS